MYTWSYFENWAGCQDCIFSHGQRTERDEAFYASVAAAASHSLCAFLSMSGAPTMGATTIRDQAPSSTSINPYCTPSGRQGPGVITGNAAGATATTIAGESGTRESLSASGAETGSQFPFDQRWWKSGTEQ